MDIAASIQKVTEKIILKILNSLKQEFNLDNLCLAGGVALNCVANGLIQREKIFKNIWIQPAAGDAGGSIGSALAMWYMYLNKRRVLNKNDKMNGSYLGPSYNLASIKSDLEKSGAHFKILEKRKMLRTVAKMISKGKAIGWFQGKMEFGPRALGSRSILADPRNKSMQKQLNLKVKFRESFRPFAPSILEEQSKNWFNLDCKSPYMLFVSDVKKNKLVKVKSSSNTLSKINQIRSVVPSITHVDNSARIQTVSKNSNPIFYELINEFYKLTQTPILINTSFNIRGEPIVCSPQDAFKCFMGTNLDVLVIENCVLEKNKQKKKLLRNYKKEFNLD